MREMGIQNTMLQAEILLRECLEREARKSLEAKEREGLSFSKHLEKLEQVLEEGIGFSVTSSPT